jgi:hypothetical protein
MPLLAARRQPPGASHRAAATATGILPRIYTLSLFSCASPG